MNVHEHSQRRCGMFWGTEQFGQRRRGSDPYSPFQETVSRGLRYVPNRDWQGKPLVGLFTPAKLSSEEFTGGPCPSEFSLVSSRFVSFHLNPSSISLSVIPVSSRPNHRPSEELPSDLRALDCMACTVGHLPHLRATPSTNGFSISYSAGTMHPTALRGQLYYLSTKELARD
jgi:hypothetical protein